MKQRKALVDYIKEKESTSDYKTAFQFIMEVNDYLPSRVRVLSSEMQGKAERDMVTTPFDPIWSLPNMKKTTLCSLKTKTGWKSYSVSC